MKNNDFKLLYNLRNNYPYKKVNSIKDISADWDVIETVNLFSSGLTEIGLNIEMVEITYPVDLEVFNSSKKIISICEMVGGSFREGLIPSLCEVKNLSYLFSSPDVMINTLDKNICNFLVKQQGINVPKWYIIRTEKDIIQYVKLKEYPYIIKPIHEGSGIGIDESSVVYTYSELSNMVTYVLKKYNQSIMIQEYVEGREITIGVVGYKKTIEVLHPIEKDLNGKKVYGLDSKENSYKEIHTYAMQDIKEIQIIKDTAKSIYSLIGCRDCSRIDFRMNNKGDLYFIEINPLPHFHPEIGDFCHSGYASGLSYESLLKKVVSRLII